MNDKPAKKRDLSIKVKFPLTDTSIEKGARVSLVSKDFLYRYKLVHTDKYVHVRLRASKVRLCTS